MCSWKNRESMEMACAQALKLGELACAKRRSDARAPEGKR
eukprot:CAMPEP_0206501280 /NCGR_PEP_ID=MMETSP0324_2-20121206/53211_1 /ASSEMBLY_ACC=CAM_ASM_000836 /TAXON_ID=2866 /ORGANISM="Crypthecodinium cohnii, Strain Seligo" /LENGTH=39 /DNA_ID= /DNA_START= /DNA_END= /DNA_ORIENTATION=